MPEEIYLDNSATTKQYNEVTELISDVSATTYGNPSSLHKKGFEAEKLITTARETIAASLEAEPKEIYFTSGGTESNNLAIRGYLNANIRKGKHIITTKTEHPSVLEVFRYLEECGYSADYIGVDETGTLDFNELESKINNETALISIHFINNETGTIQQLDKIAAIRDRLCPQAVIHIDAVQAYGKIAINTKKYNIQMLSVSSHKIHGPKGVGALYVSKKIRIKPIMFGGGQESLIRSGTENVPGIAGFGLASKLTVEQMLNNYDRLSSIKNIFIQKLTKSEIKFHINSPINSSPYILNAAFEDVRAEILLHHLEQKGIYVSTGSACSSHRKTRSHVLSAMKISPQLIDGAIRFSFSSFNTEKDIDVTMDALNEIIPLIEIHRNQNMRRQ